MGKYIIKKMKHGKCMKILDETFNSELSAQDYINKKTNYGCNPEYLDYDFEIHKKG